MSDSEHSSHEPDSEVSDAFARADADFGTPGVSSRPIIRRVPPEPSEDDVDIPAFLRRPPRRTPSPPLPRDDEPTVVPAVNSGAGLNEVWNNRFTPRLNPPSSAPTPHVPDRSKKAAEVVSEKPTKFGMSKAQWAAHLVAAVGRDLYKTYNLFDKDKTWGDRAWFFGGLVTNYALAPYFESVMPGSNRLVKAGIVAALNAVPHVIYTRGYYKKEAEIKRDFSGADMQAKLDDLWKNHYSSMQKVEKAIRNFTGGGVLGVMFEHFYGEQISKSIHEASTNLATTHNPLDGVKPFWDHSGDAPAADTAPTAAPDATAEPPANPTIVPTPNPTLSPTPNPTLAPAPSVAEPPANPATVIPKPAAIPTQNPGIPAGETPSVDIVLPAGNSVADDLKLMMHGGTFVSEENFLKVLAAHPGDQDLQGMVSAQVGKHFDLSENLARQVISQEGLDPRSIPPNQFEQVRLALQHQMEGHANIVYREDLVQELNRGTDYHVALDKVANTYNLEITDPRLQERWITNAKFLVFNPDKGGITLAESSDQVQEAIAAGVGKHIELTNQAVNLALEKANLSAAALSQVQYDQLTQGVQHTLEADANGIYAPEIYHQLSKGSIDLDKLKVDGMTNFDAWVTNQAEINHLNDVARNIVEQHLQIHDQIHDAITQEFPTGAFKEIPVPDHSDLSHVFQSQGYQIDWTPGQPHFVDTVNLFEAEAAINYDQLVNYFIQVAGTGVLGDNPHFPLSLSQLHSVANQARLGDEGSIAAMKQISEVLHYWKAGDPAKIATPEQITRIISILARITSK